MDKTTESETKDRMRKRLQERTKIFNEKLKEFVMKETTAVLEDESTTTEEDRIEAMAMMESMLVMGINIALVAEMRPTMLMGLFSAMLDRIHSIHERTAAEEALNDLLKTVLRHTEAEGTPH